ncbi:hypothetical protein BDE02_03G194400, partial [Populus trichocarpa]
QYLHIMDFQLPYCFFFLLLLLLPFSSNGQAHSNISSGLFLTAASDNLPWTSPSGEFAFGFQQVGDAGYLLAIWFNKIPERTIVWSANRNDLVQGGSREEDHFTQTLLPALIAALAAAAMATRLLPLQLSTFSLYSSHSHTSLTFCSLTLPVLRFVKIGLRQFPLFTSNCPHDRLETSLKSSKSHFRRLRFDQNNSGLMNGPNSISDPVARRISYTGSCPSARGLARLQNGSAQLGSHMVTWQMEDSSSFYKLTAISTRWAMAWTTLPNFIPSNICVVIRGPVGSGACGFNSYCIVGDDQRPTCKCLPGYTFFDPNDERKGCKKDFISQDCDHPSQEIDNFMIRDMLNTNFPYTDYEDFFSVDEDWCRQACLSDCYCAVATYNSGHCWKKRGPLSNGVTDPSIGDEALMKVRKGNRTAGSSAKKSDRSILITTGSVLLGSSIFLIVLSLLGIYVFFTRSNQQKQKVVPQLHVMPEMNLQNFTFNELETATGGFKEEVGRGAFGIVYRGALANEDKPLIAVKKLEKMAGEGDTEFNTEVKVIGRTNHKNLVQLIGFCNEGENRLLVYEYMSGGSLSNYIFGYSRPSWHRRMQIAFECSSQIIHCDIKPQNILLDESLNARISDFGLAKLLKTDQTKTTTGIRGTKGYVAPEWFKNLPVTTKVDTYSFGILLLELVCCRKNFEINAMQEDQIVLADWACDCLKEGKLNLLVEEDEEAMEDMKRVERFVMVAIWCIHEDPSLRPGMKKVVQMLEGSVQVSVPPDPSSFISTI